VIILHEVGVPGLRRVLIRLLFLLPASLVCVSCGNSAPANTQTSGIAYRAFISNSVSAGTAGAGVYIVNAANDTRTGSAPISAGNTPEMMLLTPNRGQTLVFSGNGTASSDNQFNVINNASESGAAHFSLPGMTESFVVSPDSSTAYIAVPTAPVVGESPGAIEIIALGTGKVSGTISCQPGNPTPTVCVSADPNLQGVNLPYRYLSIGNTGTRLLAFSGGAGQASDSIPNVVAVVTPSSLSTPNTVVTFVPGFDHPVWAYFNSDDTMAYVVNCGPECGGLEASIQTLDLTTNTAGIAVPVPAATVALVENSSTMYLAGTPYFNGAPSQPCTGQTTAATTCGVLTIFDLNTMSVTNATTPIIITDGYHTKLSLATNGQIFIGANNCTEITTASETRGCLSIYNTLSTAVGNAPPGGVLVTPTNGDVTGIQPIGKRDNSNGVAQQVVYVIQGYSLNIYDVTTNALEPNSHDPSDPGQVYPALVGGLYDVLTVDF
jgi:hypothetical protein